MIPQHKGKNILGISSGFIKNPFCFVLDVAGEMGDFYMLTIPGFNMYVVSNPELLKHMMTGNSSNYVRGNVFWKQIARGVGRGIATSEGPHWLKSRRLMQPWFRKNEISRYIPDMGRIVTRYYDEMFFSNKGDLVIDIPELACELTAALTLYNLLGVEPPEIKSGFYRKIKRSQEFLFYGAKYPWKRFLTNFNGEKIQFKKDVRFIDNFIHQNIRQRRKDPQPASNILTAMVNSKDQQGNPVFSDQQVRDEFITLLAGGIENSSACFGWTLYLLWKHPEKLLRLKKEIDSLIGVDQQFDEQIIQQLRYTENVIKESLRLYPSGYAIVREAVKDDILGGEKIRAGSTMYFATNVIHRDQQYWKDPDQFRPERFETVEEGRAEKEAYFPFGAGQHTCIGLYFAMAELKIMLGLLVRRYEFVLNREEPVPVKSGITPQPEGGLPFRFTNRLN